MLNLPEKTINALADILKTPRDEVATKTDLSGTVENPQSDTLGTGADPLQTPSSTRSCPASKVESTTGVETGPLLPPHRDGRTRGAPSSKRAEYFPTVRH